MNRRSKKRKDNFPPDYLLRLKLWQIVLVVFFADQLTKLTVAIFVPIVCNTGAAFGIFGGGLIFTTLMLFLVLFMISGEKSKYNLFSLALIFGGGFSNFVDRIVFGCVRDFINIFNLFPIFNVADVAITAGVFLFVAPFVFKKYKFRGHIREK